jgi:hypothetical protein
MDYQVNNFLSMALCRAVVNLGFLNWVGDEAPILCGIVVSITACSHVGYSGSISGWEAYHFLSQNKNISTGSRQKWLKRCAANMAHFILLADKEKRNDFSTERGDRIMIH